MTSITLTLMAFGVFISSVAGVICYSGPLALIDRLDWLPGGAWLLSHPAGAFAAGVTLVIGGAIYQPRQID
ncbi:MAG: hypothetical protein ACE5F9_13635 [Phycisphaerae bacterium]